MKQFIFLMTVVGLCLTGSLGWTAGNLKKDFLQKFPLKEGHYDTVFDSKQPVDFCQEEELDIELHEEASDLVLTIGPKLVFTNLQKNETTLAAEKNCEVKTMNTFQERSLKQVVTETCRKKLNYQKIHILKIDGNLINYEYSFKGQTKKCKYKFLKEVVKK